MSGAPSSPAAARVAAARVAANTLVLALATLVASWWLSLEQVAPGLVLLAGAGLLARRGALGWPREAWPFALLALWGLASTPALDGGGEWLLWWRGEAHLAVGLAAFLVASRLDAGSLQAGSGGPPELRRFFAAVGGFVGLVGVLVVLQRAGIVSQQFESPLAGLWERLGRASAFVDEFLVHRQLATAMGGSIVPGFLRQSSFFFYQGGLATALLVAQGWLLLAWDGLERRRRGWVAAALAAGLALTVLTGSRSGVLALAGSLALLVFWRLVAARPWRRWAIRGVVALVLLAALALVVPVGDPGDLYGGAAWEKVLIDFRVKSFLDRSEVYGRTLERLSERPWTGWGVQGGPDEKVRHLRLGTHSEVLNVAYRFGWVGLALWLAAALSWAAWLARRAARRPARAVFACVGAALAATALVRDLQWDLNVFWLVCAFLGSARGLLRRDPDAAAAGPGPRFSLLGADLAALAVDDLHREMAAAIEAGERKVIGHQNLHGLYLLPREPALREFARRADLVFLDGMPLVWMARRLGHAVERRHRVTYADWIEPLMAECARRGWRVFHVGGRPGVGERAAERLRERHPGLELATHPGYFAPREDAAVVAAVAAFAPDVLMVGMGMPRQEAWVVANLDKIESRVILTCGACMDYVAGAIATPPRWMGRAGLEWLFRLVSEPRRLAKRYLVEPWPVLWRFLGEWRRSR